MAVAGGARVCKRGQMGSTGKAVASPAGLRGSHEGVLAVRCGEELHRGGLATTHLAMARQQAWLEVGEQ